eukprot:8430446-Pyramimonas_sp.AAC.1
MMVAAPGHVRSGPSSCQPPVAPTPSHNIDPPYNVNVLAADARPRHPAGITEKGERETHIRLRSHSPPWGKSRARHGTRAYGVRKELVGELNYGVIRWLAKGLT